MKKQVKQAKKGPGRPKVAKSEKKVGVIFYVKTKHVAAFTNKVEKINKIFA